MILSRRVTFCGEQLDEIHEAIVIREANPGVAKETMTANDKMGGWGQRVTGQHWQTLEAQVTFAIDIPKTRMAERREVFDKVIAWANRKGWLEFSTIEDRRLYVEKTVIPGAGDMWNWINDYTIVFRAYSVPFWETKTETKVTKDSVMNGSASIKIEGTAPGVLDISFKNISGAVIPNIKIKTTKHEMNLEGVNLASYETLIIDHPISKGGVVRIRAGSRNVYGLLQGSDDLAVEPGSETVTVTATRAGALTIVNHARWV